MNHFLTESLAPLYRYLTRKKYRTYINLMSRYGKLKRFESRKIKFLGFTFLVPDVPSFLEHFDSILSNEIYLFQAKTDKPLIYDCGANIGMSVLYFKLLYPQSRIVAFEADPAIVKVLQQNISTNKLQGIELIDKAVWKDTNGIEFGQEGADAGSIFNEGAKIKIPSVRLRDMLEKEERVDFLKMDIEGAEMEVLKDCRDVLYKADNLFVEYHSYNGMRQELDEVLKIFTDNGFRYFIQTVNYRKHPLLNKMTDRLMDLQLNIYCYKA